MPPPEGLSKDIVMIQVDKSNESLHMQSPLGKRKLVPTKDEPENLNPDVRKKQINKMLDHFFSK